MKDRIVELVRVKAGDLVDHPANWRRHPRRQSQALRAMLDEVGFAAALVARREGDRLILIDGHLRKQVSADEVVPVLVVDVNEAEAATLLATLDPLSSLARPDPEALDALLAQVTVSDESMADLLEEVARSAGLPLARSGADPDLIPDEPETRTSPGDLFALGDHRLLCGDARRTDDVARLMAGEQANLLLTDPPYGVGYQGRTKRALTIEGDQAGGLAELLSSSFKACHEVLTPGAAIYVFSPSGPGQHVFLDAFIAQGWRLRQVLVWAKDVPVLSHSDYLFGHESIVYGYAPSSGRRGRGHGGWYGGDGQTSVLRAPRPTRSSEHPTAKPIELVSRLVKNSSRRGQIVFDPFAGSGSTMVACELAERRCVAMEISPSYCDVVIERFERISGERARRIGAELIA